MSPKHSIAAFIIDKSESRPDGKIHFGFVTADGERHSLCKGNTSLRSGNSTLGLKDVDCRWCSAAVLETVEGFDRKVDFGDIFKEGAIFEFHIYWHLTLPMLTQLRHLIAQYHYDTKGETP